MTATQRGRIERLMKAFEAYGDEGFIRMDSWVAGRTLNVDNASHEFIEAATQNPCGTAACLAGKAGLMKEFRDEGLVWDGARPEEYGAEVAKFFGREVTNSIFCGHWCVANLHTPRHAALVLRDFLAEFDAEGHISEDEDVDYPPLNNLKWIPSPSTIETIYVTRPNRKTFPVNGVILDRRGEFLLESWTAALMPDGAGAQEGGEKSSAEEG